MKKKNPAAKKTDLPPYKIYKVIQEDENHVSKVAEIDLSGIYSYAEYYRWKSQDRLELINGKIFRMNPASSLTHQRWCGYLYVKLYEYLADQKGEVFLAPFDVRLPDRSNRDDDIFTVVQPDILIVSNPEQLDERGCLGAPDIVIEVLSDGNNWRELIDKFKVYEAAGVKEYWIINPRRRHFFIYTLDEYGRLKSEGANMYNNGVLSTVLPGFKINLKELLNPKDEFKKNRL
jgi:Uma2 family endonuclease